MLKSDWFWKLEGLEITTTPMSIKGAFLWLVRIQDPRSIGSWPVHQRNRRIWSRSHRFLWRTMIRMILGEWSWSRSSQGNTHLTFSLILGLRMSSKSISSLTISIYPITDQWDARTQFQANMKIFQLPYFSLFTSKFYYFIMKESFLISRFKSRIFCAIYKYTHYSHDWHCMGNECGKRHF